MSPVDVATFRRKVAHTAGCLDALRPLSELSIEEYRARLCERKAAEQLLQEAIVSQSSWPSAAAASARSS